MIRPMLRLLHALPLLPRFLGLGAFASAFALAGGSGCKSTESEFVGSLPPGAGLSCTTSVSAADDAALAAALPAAAAGTCVVLTGASYAGPVSVPAGVSLVAQNGSRAAFTGGTAQNPTLTLGEGA